MTNSGKWRLMVLLGVFAILLTSSVLAQVPGYLGKRFSAGYAISAIPPLGTNTAISSNYNGTKAGLLEGEFYLDLRHSLQMHWTVSRRSALGLDLSWFRQGRNARYSFGSIGQNTLGQAQFYGIGLAYKHWPFIRRGNIAPVGPFTELRYHFFLGRLFDPAASVRQSVASGWMGTAFWHSGNTWVVADRLLFTLGIELGFPFLNGLASPPLISAFFTEGDERELGRMITDHTFFKFRGGLSFLIF